MRECSEKRARADAQVLQGVADGPHEHCTKNVLTTLGARRCRQQFGVGWARKSNDTAPTMVPEGQAACEARPVLC